MKKILIAFLVLSGTASFSAESISVLDSVYAYCSEDSSRKCLDKKESDLCDWYIDFEGRTRQRFCKGDGETINGNTNCTCSKLND